MLLVLGFLAGWVEELFHRFIYLGPFLVLFLCGLGLPLPEEVTLIGSGLLLYEGKVEFLPITLVCSAGILLGDMVPYALGRRYGLAALKIRWVAKILHPERFAILERRFERHGNWVVFTFRFLPGIRLPGYFTAGTMGMGFWRFFMLDGLGVLVSVPISIYIGKLFGGSIEDLQASMDNLHLILGFGVAALVLVIWFRARNRRREREARMLAEENRMLQDPGTDEGRG